MKPLITVLASVILILVTFCPTAFAEKTVVTAQGKYVMGDLDSKQNAKTLALMEAKRMSLEKAGTYIESISEVRDFQLTKDQINSLAAGIMSVEIIKEEWKMSGETMTVTLSVRATIDTAHLKARVAALQENQGAESNREIKAQLAALQKELNELKASQAAVQEKATPSRQMKEKNESIIKEMTGLESLEEGHAALRVQRWNEAIAAYKNTIAMDPRSADAYAGMAIACLGIKDHVKAVDAVETALKINPKSPFANQAMSRVMYEEGKFDLALKSVNRAIELYSKSPFYYFNRAEIYIKLQNHAAALKDYELACKMTLQPACKRVEMLKKRIAALEHVRDGHRALQAELWNAALSSFQQAIDTDPGFADAYAGMALALIATKKQGKAVEMIKKALKLDPKCATGHFARARVMYDRGIYDEALKSVNYAITLYPKSPYYFLNRGLIFVKLQDDSSALKDFERACQMNLPQACKRAEELTRLTQGK